MRQIVLDTETTGLEPEAGHRIIEIGCVELLDRRLTGKTYHQYINPEREIDAGAMEVHGITNEFVADKPAFLTIADEFLAFIDGAELIIHNAPFDVGFIDHEVRLGGLSWGRVSDHCAVVDTLVMARRLHPGRRNNLDALCARYFVDNTQRELHGALLDAEILADVFLAMTSGQTALALGGQQQGGNTDEGENIRPLDRERAPLPIIPANQVELEAHQQFLALLDKKSNGQCLWPVND